MIACSDCGLAPKLEKVKGFIHPTYFRLRCTKCGKQTHSVKDDYGSHSKAGENCRKVIADEWESLNKKRSK